MSDTSDNTFGIDIDPIPGVSTRESKYSLGPDFQFTERPVTQGSSALTGTKDIYGEQYFVQKSGKTFYRGPGLVNGNGVISRDPYDPSNISGEAYRYLSSLGRGERISRLNFFADRGLYDGGKPSTSTFDSKDLNATAQYLLYLNRIGVTDDIGLSYLKNEYPGGNLSTGRTVRVTSKDDLTKVLAEESFRQLGRSMTPREVRDAVQFVQSRERQAALGGAERSPALSTLAETAVTRGRGTETDLEGFRNLSDLLERTLGGG